MLKFTIGSKVRKGARSVLTEASADDPIYTRGFAVGGITARRTSVAPEPPDDLEVQAFRDYEQALSRSLEEKVKESPSSKPDLSPFELEARQSLEESIHRLYEHHTGQPWREPNQSSESTTPESPAPVSQEDSTEQE